MSWESGESTTIRRRLEALPPDKRRLALQRLAERGIVLPSVPWRRDPPVSALTVKQQSLAALHASGDSGSFYHVAAVISDLPGRGDPQERIERVVADHETLRTSYHADPWGKYHPWVAEKVRPTPIHIQVGPGHLPDKAEEAVAELAHAPFSLDEVPVRWVVIAGGRRVALGVIAHDIALDRHGIHAVLGPALGQAGTDAGGDDAPNEGLRPRDIAAWQQEELDGGVLSAAVERRASSLRGAALLRFEKGSRTGASLPVRVPSGLVSRLRRRVRQARASLFVGVLNAWCVAAARASGEPSIAVGSCLSGRTMTGTEGVLGNLANTVAISPRNPTDSLTETASLWAEALADSEAPLERVLSGRTSAGTLVQDEDMGVRLTFYDGVGTSKGTRPQVRDVDLGHAKTALGLDLAVVGEELNGLVEYRPADVSDSTAQYTHECFMRRLHEMADE